MSTESQSLQRKKPNKAVIIKATEACLCLAGGLTRKKTKKKTRQNKKVAYKNRRKKHKKQQIS